ncbi:hypothetical protein F4775DRAFT_177098 [Biscogniauxia sp. FL1348]|nr:hypothetical protein F4775DRAFT_177098 [Biscogniauxia sp. FL1348]
MFRDESTKVIQKAHAQWGTSGSPSDSSSSSSSGSDTASPPGESSHLSTVASTSASETPALVSAALAQQIVASSSKVPRRVEPTLEQRGLQFYIDRYLLNHPDSPKTPEIADHLSNEASQNVMVAVGLAGMSNLLGNKSMGLVSRSKYVTALKQVGQAIATGGSGWSHVAGPIRSIVTLAMFEVVQGKGSATTAGSANMHINGALALFRTVLPNTSAPGGVRPVLQLIYAMFIPCQVTDTPLPPAFFECLKICKNLLRDAPEACSTDLALLIARLMQLSDITKHTVLVDEQPATDDLLQQFLLLDSSFDELEPRLFKAYPYTVHRGGNFPREAVFRGKWHTYTEIWGARLWNHYRWARVLLSGEVIQLMGKYPRSSGRHVPPVRRVRCYAVAEQMAEDTLVSTPTHWHHPVLDAEAARRFETVGKTGGGSVGLPTLLWQLVIAGCAPNAGPELWNWVHETLQVVWKAMGMHHALSLAEYMVEHRNKLEKAAAAAQQQPRAVKVKVEGDV